MTVGELMMLYDAWVVARPEIARYRKARRIH